MRNDFRHNNEVNPLIRIELFDRMKPSLHDTSDMYAVGQDERDFAKLLLEASDAGATNDQILIQVRNLEARGEQNLSKMGSSLGLSGLAVEEELNRLKDPEGKHDSLVEAVSKHVHNLSPSYPSSRKALDTKLTFPHRFPETGVVAGLQTAASWLYSNVVHRNDNTVQRFSDATPTLDEGMG